MSLRPTLRGIALGVVGAAVTLTGIAAGSPLLTQLGLVGVVALVGGLGYAWLTDPARGSGSLSVERSVDPDPVTLGQRAVSRAVVRAHGIGERIRLTGLRLGEQAAVELSGGRPLRARVDRSPGQVSLTYAVHATLRGRWELGPLDVRHADPFGLATTRSSLGAALTVTVWPAVTELPLPSDTLVAEPDRVALGSRSPAPDDAALRDYRVGDDLRRVHWRSTARLGDLVVRSDERAGMRPAAVLLDLPPDGPATEWTISLGASVALALLGADHPVRLVGGRATASAIDPAIRDQHLRDTGGSARATLLDLTVDLEPARDRATAEADLVAAANGLAQRGTSSELVVAVVGPLGGPGRAALAGLAEVTDPWALVRTDQDEDAAQETLAELRRAGWRAVLASSDEPVEVAWARLVGGAP